MLDGSELWDRFRELEDSHAELMDRVLDLENDFDSKGESDTQAPDEIGSIDWTEEEWEPEEDGDEKEGPVTDEEIDEYLATVDKMIPPLNEEEDDHPHAYLGRE